MKGTFLANGASFGSISADGAKFSEKIEWNGASVMHKVVLRNNAILEGPLYAQRIQIGGFFKMQGAFGSVDLWNAVVTGGISLSHSTFGGVFDGRKINSPSSFNVDNSEFGGDLLLDGA